MSDRMLRRNASHVLRVGGEVPRVLVRGQAERLARRFEGDAVVDDGLVGERGKRRVFLALGDEVAVDFVGQQNHPALEADLADAHQVRRAPAVACRVLRIAEDVRVGVGADAPLEVLEVQRVSAVDDLHLVLFGDGAAGSKVAVKAVVGRCVQQHLGAARAKCLERGDEGRMHAGRKRNRSGIDVQVVALLVPRHHQLRHFLGRGAHVEVAPVFVLEPFLESLGDRRRGAEVHVGDAHAHLDAARAVVPDLLIELGAVGPKSVVDGVEVELPVLRRFEGGPGSRGHQRSARSNCADNGGHPGVSEERSAIQPIAL